MPSGGLFFGNDQQSGDQQLAGASPLAINVVADGVGAVRRRPGISAWDGFPDGMPTNAVEGLYDFEDALYVVYDDRRIYRIADGVATNLSTGGGPSYLAGSGRPVFAETAFRLVIAGGSEPEKVDSGESVAERLGGSPPDSTHIVALASRLASNDLTDASTDDRIRYSATGSAGNETWDALGFVTAEARPDGIVSLHAGTNQLYAFGGRTLQVFTPDASTIFAPLSTLQRGCAAPHGVIQVDDDFVWLTEKRVFVQSDGRSLTELSLPISATLDDMTTVSDAYGFRWSADQFDCLAWLFPTDGRTFVNQNGGGWAQWHGWTHGAGHTPFPITAFHYWHDQNLHLVGQADGTIAKLDSSAPTDLGGTIKAETRTGFINRDTDAHKHCQAVRFTFKRGHATGTTEPVVLLSWRDTLGDFCPPLRLSLGTTGDHVFTVERRSLGTYRSRQWRLEFTEAVDFVLARAEEIFSIGGQN
jgi:hypothetical protein